MLLEVIAIYLFGILYYVHDNTALLDTTGYKTVTRGLLWPILFIIWFGKAILGFLNNVILFVTIMVEYDYISSKMYKRIVDIIYK